MRERAVEGPLEADVQALARRSTRPSVKATRMAFGGIGTATETEEGRRETPAGTPIWVLMK
jgi:hypothetical protein